MLILLLWGIGSPAVAQQSGGETELPLRFERLEGLSQNTVFSLLQDQRGFLWIGTADGLNRYDGYRFTVYRHDPRDSTAIVDNTVQALREDAKGNLWVGTAGGLDRLDRTAGRFVHYDLTPDPSNDATSVARVIVDGAGHVWVTTYSEAQLYRYHRPTDTFRRYLPDAWVDVVNGVQVGPHGALWVAGKAESDSTEGLTVYRYDPEQDQFHALAKLPRGPFYVGRSGRVWIRGEPSGSFGRPPASVHRLPASVPWGTARNEMHESRDGILWIGSGRGIFRYDSTTEDLVQYPIDTTGTSGLSNYVWDIVEDRAGILWVGTRSGLYRYDPHRKPFAHLGPSSGILGERGQSAVMALADDADGTLWVGTLGGGLVHLRRTNGAYHSSEASYSLPSDRVWALHEDSQDRLWIGTAEGACVLRPSKQRCVPQPPWGSGEDDPGPVYAFAESPDGALWMGGTDLYRLDPDAGRVTAPVPLDYGKDFTTIQALHVDRSGRLWVGMEHGGVAQYRPASDRLVSDPVADDTTGLRAETVWTIHAGAAGVLWLGTDLGLARLHPAAGTVTHHVELGHRPGSIVYSILEDDPGRLWMGTNRGLVRFDPNTERFRRFDASDGVGNTEFNRRAAIRGPRGRFFFGGLRGITTFDPEAIRDNPYVPPVVITRITKVNRSGPVSVRPYERDHVVLDYRDRVFTLEYSALNFTNPHKNRYVYRLEGFEENWVEARSRRTVRYTNVPPGEYVFRVKGSNNDGVWNEKGTSMHVTITPPFWQTGWFRFLIGLLVVGGLVLAYRVRVQHLLRIERLRLQIARDLHDDVASQLSSVAIASDVLRTAADLTEDEREELRQMGTLVRQTTKTLRDIVWFVDPEHDRPNALLGKMKTVASRLLGEVDYRFDDPAPDKLAGLDALDVQARRNLFLIFKEALHNVARHADAETVQITLNAVADGVGLTIADDGVGFDPEDPAEWGQGMKTMRRRADQIGADLEIDSRAGDGTTLRLTVPES